MCLPAYEAMGCIMMDHDQSSCLPVVGLIRKLNVIFQYFQTNVRPLPEKIDKVTGFLLLFHCAVEVAKPESIKHLHYRSLKCILSRQFFTSSIVLINKYNLSSVEIRWAAQDWNELNFGSKGFSGKYFPRRLCDPLPQKNFITSAVTPHY